MNGEEAVKKWNSTTKSIKEADFLLAPAGADAGGDRREKCLRQSATVAFIAADLDLAPFPLDFAVRADPDDHRRLSAAPADRLEF